MSALTEALDRILNWLQHHRPSDVSLLQPGLSEAEIEEIVADLPWRLPNDIRQLYQWKNGTRIAGEYWEFAWTFEVWAFYPLQIVVDGYRDRMKYYEYEPWHPSYGFDSPEVLSIFFSVEPTDTGYVIVDDRTQEASPVVFQSCKAGACSPIIKYASLTNMILTIAESYKTAYCANAQGYLIPDKDKTLQIWRKYNSYQITEAALAKLDQELSLELLFEVEADLIQAKHPMAVQPLIQALQKPIVTEEDLAIQGLAVKVLGELGDVRAVDHLIRTLQNENCTTRYWAAKSLGQLRDERAVEPLIIALQDSEPEVQRMARWALKQLNSGGDNRAKEVAG